eukprot:GAHX01001412.1.p1 GENE.GAHX01001412.1~~GAHX01001412.1.p1  ORF type:complete len:526 (-),score=90.62 GAHX01001412.1:511-2088(-)
MTEHNTTEDNNLIANLTDSNISDLYRPNKVKSFKIASCDNTVETLLRNNSFIDKTKEYMWLLSSSPKILLIRPRRMGKSTTLNFLKFICRGPESREFFKGTYIYNQPWTDFANQYIDIEGNTIKINSEEDKKRITKYPWHKYPVFMIDFKIIGDTNVSVVKSGLIEAIYETAVEYGIQDMMKDPESVDSLRLYLTKLIILLTRLGNGYRNKVVVLIDEYDSIFMGYKYANETQKQEMKMLLQEFYSVLKNPKTIKIKILTGITTITFTDVYQISNDIVNVSMDEQFAKIVGFTKKEIETMVSDKLFKKLAKNVAKSENCEVPKGKKDIKTFVMDKLEDWYNGYRFSLKGDTVYNTLSVVRTFMSMNITNHWNSSLTSEFQFHEILRDPQLFFDIGINGGVNDVRIEDLFGKEHITKDPKKRAIAALYQTGLLTMNGNSLDEKNKIVGLIFPNKEVIVNYQKATYNLLKQTLTNLEPGFPGDLKIHYEREEWYEFFQMIRKMLTGKMAKLSTNFNVKLFGFFSKLS